VNDKDFFVDHHAYHEQQRARVVLLSVGVGLAFVFVLLMAVIAFMHG
jgi:hypothetical protein